MVYDYEWFKDAVQLITGLDLNYYKEAQMKRRIDTLIARVGCQGYDDYAGLLYSNEERLAYFVDYITINVTEFFRDPEYWTDLSDNVVPRLIESFGEELTLWSAACSSGEEPYSLAMLMSRHVPVEKIKVIATDVDNKSLKRAIAGVYAESAVESIPEDLRERFFKYDGAGYKVTDELRNCVEFRKMDLLKEAYPTGCHLIACRNVLIYFTPEAKDMVFDNFRNSLHPGGVLFMGRTEQIVNWKGTGYIRQRPCFYWKERK